MKKAVAILCVLLVAAVAGLGVTLLQKNDLQARLTASESTVQALENDRAEAVQALEDARQELEHVKADAAQAADEAAKAAQEAAQKLEETRADAARAAQEAAKELENVKADVAKELENVKASLQEQVNQAMEGVKAQFGTEAEPVQEQQPEEEAAEPAEEQPEGEETAAPAEEQPAGEEAAAPAEEQQPEEEAAVPAEEQPAGEEAAETAQEQQPEEEAALPEYAVAYVMFESADPAVAYRNDGAETSVIPMNAEIRDYGFYIVSLDFSQVEGGQAAGVKALALNILNGEKLFPGALVRVTALRVNGEEAALGKGCAYSEDGSAIRVDIYSENPGDPPADARTADGSLDGASQSLVDAALFDAVKTIEIEFELIAAQ